MREETEALLLSKGMSFSKHSAVIAAFGEHFALPGLLDAKFHRYLIEGFEVRQVADYEAREEVSQATARTTLDRASEFLQAAKSFLYKPGSPDCLNRGRLG